MKLSPHEILCHLGFNIPPDGIEISANEAVFHTESLRILGDTIKVADIPDIALLSLLAESKRLVESAICISSVTDSALNDYHAGLAQLIILCKNNEAAIDHKSDSKIIDWLRVTITHNMKTYFKRN